MMWLGVKANLLRTRWWEGPMSVMNRGVEGLRKGLKGVEEGLVGPLDLGLDFRVGQ